MTTDTKPKPETASGLITRMAQQRGVDPAKFHSTLCKTVMPSAATQEDVMVFLMVCEQYGLNPFLRQVYAFPGKSGGIQTVLSVDGWMAIANQHPQFDGMQFEDHLDKDGKIVAITCRVHRKDRDFPVCATEYMSECVRNTDPWKQWPARMLRHKATIQAIRLAFGISGLLDQDEYERAESVSFHPEPRRTRLRQAPPLELPAPMQSVEIVSGSTEVETDVQ